MVSSNMMPDERYGGTFNYSANAYSLSYGIGFGNFGIGLTGRMLADNFSAEGVESQSGFGGVDVGLMGHALHIDVGEEKVPTFHYGHRCEILGGCPR